jgi:hypothetical protein
LYETKQFYDTAILILPSAGRKTGVDIGLLNDATPMDAHAQEFDMRLCDIPRQKERPRIGGRARDLARQRLDFRCPLGVA